jgi:hypothetical protein
VLSNGIIINKMYLKYSLYEIILSMCILICNVLAQSDTTEGNKLLNRIQIELNQKGIDTLIILKKGCAGNENLFKKAGIAIQMKMFVLFIEMKGRISQY